MTCQSAPVPAAAAGSAQFLALHRTGQAKTDAVDAARASDALEVVIGVHRRAADSAGRDTIRDPDVAQGCLIGMGAPRHVARRVGSGDLRTLNLGRYPPVRLTLGAAAVLHVAQRRASIGTTPAQVFGHAHDVAHRVANLTPDRTFATVLRG
jgi:hypothetical protein